MRKALDGQFEVALQRTGGWGQLVPGSRAGPHESAFLSSSFLRSSRGAHPPVEAALKAREALPPPHPPACGWAMPRTKWYRALAPGKPAWPRGWSSTGWK